MRTILVMAGLLTCGIATPRAQSTPVDIIVTRQAGYDLMASALGAVDLATKAKVQVKSFAGAGAAISAWAKQIPSLFPPGSDKGSRATKAKPEIWTD